ncbi:MAG: tetratricopeptide repeat protein [Alphaproteobacteria bacterium]|nr:tetratricopeptide repeat protein [Alphaproteobacteria bacterium]
MRDLAGMLVLAGVLAALPAGAAASQQSTPTKAAAAEAPSDEAADSQAFGDYLAGRFAIVNRDTDAAADYYIKAVDDDPTNVELAHQAFSVAIASGRQDAAVKLAHRLEALNEKPTSLTELVLLIDELKRNQLDEAKKRVAAMPRTGIVELMAPVIKAWIDAAQGQTDAALKSLDALSANKGFTIFMKTHKAYILDYAGKVDEAAAAYDEAVDMQKGADLRLVLAYAHFLDVHGKPDKAKAVYDAYLEHYPSNVLIEAAQKGSQDHGSLYPDIHTAADGVAEALFSTGRALAQERSRGSAVMYLRLALALKPDFPVAYLLLGDVLDRDGQQDEALKVYDKVTGDPVLGEDARYEKALLYNEMDEPDKAIATLEALLKDSPDSLNVMTSLADTLRGEEHFAEARAIYDKVIDHIGKPSERHWVLFYARGITYERMDMWDKAEADFKKALELSPDQPLVLNYLGYSWIEQGTNMDQALGMIQKAVEQRPDDGYIVDSLGWALYRMKRYDEAVDWLEKAAALIPEDPTINDHLGDAYWQIGRRLEATFQWRHALAMKPEKDEAQQLEAKIKSGLDTETRSEK